MGLKNRIASKTCISDGERFSWKALIAISTQFIKYRD